MSAHRHLRHLALTACVFVVTLWVPVAASASIDLIIGVSATRAVGTDRIAVWVCEVPIASTHDAYASSPERVDIDPAAVAQWAQAEVAADFLLVSGGRYRMVFEIGGRLTLAPTDGPSDCLTQAQRRTSSPFTNVLATDTYIAGRRRGFATPGGMYADPRNAPNLLGQAPADSGRGAYMSSRAVGGHSASEPVVGLLVHEMGHTLGWPHSYSGHHDAYDNPLDVMSLVGGRPRSPFATLAVNRLAAGWLDSHQVHVHRTGTSDVTLRHAPEADTQLALVPSVADPRVLLTLEATTSPGFGTKQSLSGVAVHVVDQTTQHCTLGDSGADCYGILRRQGQAWGAAHSHDHVLTGGGRVAIDGVIISVSQDHPHGYRVRIEGEYRPTDPFRHTGPRRLNPIWDHVQSAAEEVSGILFGVTLGAALGLVANHLRIRRSLQGHSTSAPPSRLNLRQPTTEP